MTETKAKRRNWVKNAVIIFLVVLLLLTFFSNTILNRSLPEVAYQYPSSGSITAMLRGTGTVSSNETYEVTINEERKVRAIAPVSVGDTVEAGDNLILLDETESEALTTARDELATLELAYQKKLLELSFDSDSADSIQLQILQAALDSALSDQNKASEKESAVSAAEAKVATAKAKLESAEASLGANSSTEKAALDAAQTAYDNAVATQTQAKTNLEYYQGVSGGEDYSAVMKSYETAAEEYLELQTKAQELSDELLELRRAQTQLERYTEDVEEIQEEIEELETSKSQATSGMSTVSGAAGSLSDGTGESILPTTSITDTEGNTIYIYYCTNAELRTYLEELEAWLKAYNANGMITEAPEGNSSEEIPSEGTTSDDSNLASAIASSIETLNRALNASVDIYEGNERVECNGRQYYLNGMDKSSLNALYDDLQSWSDRLERQISDAQQELKDAQKALSDLEASSGTTASAVASAIRSKEDEITQNDKDLAAKQKEMGSLQQTINDPDFAAAYQELMVANELVNTTTKALYDAQTAYNAVYSEKELEELQQELDDARQELADVESDYASVPDADTARSNVLNAQKSIEDYYDTLTQAEQEDALADLDLQAQKTELEEAQAKVEQLEENVSQQIINAEYGGVITAINVGAGSYTTAGEPLMVIERVDNGYTMSFSVTTEQAGKVKVGDQAQLVNQYGTDITAVLANITNDPDNPGTNKLLVFSLSGSDVVAGQSLTVQIGERSASYDLIVPNSAVRTDATGKFVLAITVKTSPLGNRYIARRVDVEVLASDDNNSAIRGDLSSGDTIITTSSTPIESGMQVRLAE